MYKIECIYSDVLGITTGKTYMCKAIDEDGFFRGIIDDDNFIRYRYSDQFCELVLIEM